MKIETEVITAHVVAPPPTYKVTLHLTETEFRTLLQYTGRLSDSDMMAISRRFEDRYGPHGPETHQEITTREEMRLTLPKLIFGLYKRLCDTDPTPRGARYGEDRL